MPESSRLHWSTISVDGHACELFEPSPRRVAGRAIIYLHDLDEGPLQQSTGIRDLFEAAGLPLIAPRAGRSWWLDRIVPAFDRGVTPERFVVDGVRTEIDRRFGVQNPGIAVIGTGMGGQGALRIAYRHPTIFPVAGAIAPSIDFHLAMRDADSREDGGLFATLWETYGDVERGRQDTAILHVHPLNWPRHQCFAADPADLRWHDGAARLHGKLVALGIPHVAWLEGRGGNGPAFRDAAAGDVLRFVLEALDREALRIA